MKKIENPSARTTVSESSETAIDLSVAILEKGVDDAFLTKQAQELGSKGQRDEHFYSFGQRWRKYRGTNSTG
ncbi:hypothetical protein [Labilibacter marinus]|uniref:hypothetical protein n=1 Tax=Labilibacter marinus TaxID=1477105 RepID=UPI00094FCFEF|nr:hypothetical protein [Labilibacter marinus]